MMVGDYRLPGKTISRFTFKVNNVGWVEGDEICLIGL